MSWEAIATISQVIGTVLVFITLIYLALQVRSNSRQIRSQNLHAATQQTHQIMQLLTVPGIVEARVKVVSGEPLCAQDVIYLEAFVASALSSFCNQYEHYKAGLGDSDWPKTRVLVGDFLVNQWSREWWREYGRLRFEQSFVEEVNGILAEQLGDQDYMSRLGAKASDKT